MKIKPENHTFVICAYKESPYLEECIRSLKNQSVRTNLRMAASTDNGHIRALAEKYGIPLDINPGRRHHPGLEFRLQPGGDVPHHAGPPGRRVL